MCIYRQVVKHLSLCVVAPCCDPLLLLEQMFSRPSFTHLPLNYCCLLVNTNTLTHSDTSTLIQEYMWNVQYLHHKQMPVKYLNVYLIFLCLKWREPITRKLSFFLLLTLCFTTKRKKQQVSPPTTGDNIVQKHFLQNSKWFCIALHASLISPSLLLCVTVFVFTQSLSLTHHTHSYRLWSINQHYFLEFHLSLFCSHLPCFPPMLSTYI